MGVDHDDADLRDLARLSLRALTEVIDDVVLTLRADHDFANEMIERIDATGLVSEATQEMDVASMRGRVTRAVKHLEAARLQARRDLFRAMLEEGATIAEVARCWGISRQLTSRIVNADIDVDVQSETASSQS